MTFDAHNRRRSAITQGNSDRTIIQSSIKKQPLAARQGDANAAAEATKEH